MAKVSGTDIKEVLNINIGFRPGLNSRFGSTSSVGSPSLTGTSGASKFPSWFERRSEIPGLGFVWDKYPMSALKPENPIHPNLSGAFWENWYYYLREAMYSGEVDEIEPYTGPGTATGDIEVGANLRRFESSEDKGMQVMGASMRKGVGDTLVPTRELGGLGFNYRNERQKGGKKFLKSDPGYLPALASILPNMIRIDEGNGGGHWMQYPKSVGTGAWLKNTGPQVTFDEMRRTAHGPIQEILDYFLLRVEGATQALQSGKDTVEQVSASQGGEGSSFDEKLIGMLRTEDNKEVGFIPEDHAIRHGYNPGHRIDVRFNEKQNIAGGRLDYSMADITSSYFHKGLHHGVGKGDATKKTGAGSYLGRTKNGEPIIKMDILKNHWNGRIDKFNTILRLLFNEVGKTGTLSQKREKVVGIAKERMITRKGSGAGFKPLEEVRKLINSLDSGILEDSSKEAMKTVEWVLHHMGDAIIGETYANIMPIQMNHSDGILIVVFKVNKDGTYAKINPNSGSELSVVDMGLTQALLNLAQASGDSEVQRKFLQNVARAYTTTGYRGIRGGQVIMNSLNILATKSYKVAYGVPIDDDIKDVLHAKFVELTSHISPSGPEGKIKREIINYIKNRANSYSEELRRTLAGTGGSGGRLGYTREAAQGWLSGHPQKPVFNPLPDLDNLWAQPYFTISKKMRPPGETATSPKGFLREVEGKSPEWVIYYRKARGARLEKNA